ncbi:homoserine O-acetyltransferase MetX [Thermicanus aegyptius]|uniref:homoserine O-acetyltransferase MetX n=1 Tax=Thermicanus aegyptius TaxID=94009 RepID=UPI001FE1EAAF|nr:homoserine O-acetyltransferase [Thermicanus aegyptius]
MTKAGTAIQPHTGVLPIGDLLLESGKVLPNVKIAYERVGPESAPTILVCHALTGNQYTVGSESAPGWWRELVGPERFIDTNRFQVITTNVIGGCNGSTGPLSPDPNTGEAYRSNFPFITVRDMVHAQHRFLQKIGISHLKAVIGGSLGGMQVLEWGLLYPDFMDLIIPIAVTPFLSDYAISFNAIGRLAILNDPAWKEGMYDPEEQPIMGLSIARIAGLLTYRTPKLFNHRFSREMKGGWGSDHREIAFQVESYLTYQGEKLSRRFDANSYLYLLKAMDYHDIGRGRGGVEKAVEGYRSQVVALAFQGDLLYPPDEIFRFVGLLREKGVRADYHEVTTHFGHDGFLTEFDRWGGFITDALKSSSLS